MRKLPLKKIFLTLVIILLFISLAATSGFFYVKYDKTNKELQRLKTDPNAYSQTQEEESKRILEEVSKIFALPKDEKATIATIIDAEKLKNTQPIFQNAQNGYKLILYTTKAILYDPINKRVVDTSPIFQNPLASLSNYKVQILNGTRIPNLSQRFEEELKVAVPSVTITGNAASKGSYTKSLIIDLTGTKDKETQQFSQALNFEVSKLPEAEVKPENADFLLIVGPDKEFLLQTPTASPQASPASPKPTPSLTPAPTTRSFPAPIP